MIEPTIPQPDVTTATMSSEQGADLAALQSLVNEGEAQAGQAQAAQQEQAAFDQEAELAGIIHAAGAILSGMFGLQSLSDVYTEERAKDVAKKVNPAFELLGWNITGGKAMIYGLAISAIASLFKDSKKAIEFDLEQTRLKYEHDQMVAAGLRTE